MFRNHLNRIIVFSMLASLCIVAGCAGFWTSRTDNISTSNFAFVANANFSSGADGQGFISIFTTNPTTGALTVAPNVSSGTTGSSSNTLAYSPVAIVTTAGKFIYTANDGGSVSGFTWDTTTGALTAVPSSPIATVGFNPTALVVDHTGKFLYVADSGSMLVEAFSINATTGALTLISTTGYTTADYPAGITVHPTLNVLYVAINSTGVETFTINADGSLSSGTVTAPLASGTSQAVLISNNGKFAYIANGLSAPNGGIEVWNLNATTGLLSTAVTGMPSNPIKADDTPAAMVTDPTGSFLIAVNQNSDDISFYSMSSTTGVLTMLNGGSPINVVTSSSFTPALSNIAMDPTGKFVYVTVIDSTPSSGGLGANTPGVVLFQLSTSNGGTLTKIAPSTSSDGIQAGTNPSGIVLP